MIYMSSSCVKNNKIKDSVLELAKNGFTNIELSGGTNYYAGFENDLLELRDKYNLNYICHNYFPPSQKHFVLNLASLNDEIYEKTYKHIAKTIKLSKKIGATQFGFHAGFYIDVKLHEIGSEILKSGIFDRDKAIERFCLGYNNLTEMANKYDIELYIENNVVSFENYENFENKNVFMLTNFDDFMVLKEKINFHLLLDVAHLFVSANTLKLNFNRELGKLLKYTRYIHLSDNNAVHDQHEFFEKDSQLLEKLKQFNFSKKVITLETKGNLNEIEKSYNILIKELNI